VDKRFSTILIVFLLVALLLGACAPQSPSRPSNSVGPVIEATARPPLPTSVPTQVSEESGGVEPVQRQLTEEEINEIVGRILTELEKGEPAAPDSLPLVGAPSVQSGYREFAEFVAARVDMYWKDLLTRSGQISLYQSPTVEVWSSTDMITYGLGKTKDPRSGPFYYVYDETIYLPDPSIYEELWRVEGKMTPFASAYLIAHEAGHHIQNRLGIWDAYDKMWQEAEKTKNKTAQNFLSQRVELQADCFAGSWANSEYYQGTLEPGELEQAIALSGVIGDDVLGNKTNPADMDHGTGELRKSWFLYGYNTGDPSKCGEVWNEPSQTTQTQPTPTPAVVTQTDTLVETFFVLASDPSCEWVTDEVTDTVQTRRCSFSDGTGTIAVDYDEWVGEQAWLKVIFDAQEAGNLVLNDTWSAASETAGTHGPYIAWVNTENKVILMWGVDAYRLTGTLYWYNTDAAAAEAWFFEQASRHYAP